MRDTSATFNMIPVYDLNCARDLGLDGTRALPICSPTMIHVNVNAGWRVICRAARGIRERCVSSGRNSSVFELIWTVDLQASRLPLISYAAFSTGSPASKIDHLFCSEALHH